MSKSEFFFTVTYDDFEVQLPEASNTVQTIPPQFFRYQLGVLRFLGQFFPMEDYKTGLYRFISGAATCMRQEFDVQTKPTFNNYQEVDYLEIMASTKTGVFSK